MQSETRNLCLRLHVLENIADPTSISGREANFLITNEITAIKILVGSSDMCFFIIDELKSLSCLL